MISTISQRTIDPAVAAALPRNLKSCHNLATHPSAQLTMIEPVSCHEIVLGYAACHWGGDPLNTYSSII
jgi:hypothetical protein